MSSPSNIPEFGQRAEDQVYVPRPGAYALIFDALGRLLSRDSILLWCLQTNGRNRRRFREELERPESQPLRLLHFQSPRQTEAWLTGLPRSADVDEEQEI